MSEVNYPQILFAGSHSTASSKATNDMMTVLTVIESFVLARDRFMKKATPGTLDIASDCNMFPSTSNIYVAPFCDEELYAEQYNKTLFFAQVRASMPIGTPLTLATSSICSPAESKRVLYKFAEGLRRRRPNGVAWGCPTVILLPADCRCVSSFSSHRQPRCSPSRLSQHQRY